MRFLPFFALTLLILASGCYRSNEELWDDTLTCGHHMERGIESLGGKREDSRQVSSADDFFANDESAFCYSPDLMPYFDEGNDGLYSMSDIPASKHSPGDPGSQIPGLDGFKEPTGDPVLSKVFRPAHFDYNSNQIRGQENMQILQNIAGFMKQHPNVYVFIEGHCDKRGPEAYNFALGSRRANEVRGFLVSEGISTDKLFTISYGKERLIANGDDDQSHRLNRRAVFKVYEK